MTTVQLPGSKEYETQMYKHYATHKYSVGLAQKRLSNASCKNLATDQVKNRKFQLNGSGYKNSIRCNMIIMWCTKV